MQELILVRHAEAEHLVSDLTGGWTDSSLTNRGRRQAERLVDWEKHPDAIGEAVDELCARSDYDPSRPVIEFYRSHTELVIRVPVH
jgi:phosphohistidine phosphatase SixA